jgi:hypothetical protein
LLALFVCGSPARSTDDDRLALSAQLDSIEALFVPGEVMNHVLVRYVESFADDAVLLTPEAEPVVGREAILACHVAGFEGLGADLPPVRATRGPLGR